ncbi:MAG: hypothetical protein Q9171_001776 [Xanthocarpia ochracea]
MSFFITSSTHQALQNLSHRSNYLTAFNFTSLPRQPGTSVGPPSSRLALSPSAGERQIKRTAASSPITDIFNLSTSSLQKEAALLPETAHAAEHPSYQRHLCRMQRKRHPRSNEAYPVYQVGRGQFLVPATKSDYRVLRRLQDRTSARTATLRFIESSRVPGGSRRISCISIKMPDVLHDSLKSVDSEISRILNKQGWTYKGEVLRIAQTGSQDCKLKFSRRATRQRRIQQPDSSLLTVGAKFPFLVVEVANSQTQKSVDKKVHWWVQGSKQHLKVIIVLRVKKKPDSLYIYMDVIKPSVVSTFIPGHPNGFRVEKEYVLQNEEIYPGTSQTNFAIHYAEVLPRESAQTSQSDQPSATIDLKKFYKIAKQAVTNLTAQKGDDDSSSGYDTDQESTPSTPTDSKKSLPKDEEQSIETKEESSCEYEPDDSDNDEPYQMPPYVVKPWRAKAHGR